jgi:hypothetical protein
VELGVFDGKHSIDLKLQVESSPPFIKVLNNSQLMLRQGGAATITTYHMYADTNLNIHSDKIKLVFIFFYLPYFTNFIFYLYMFFFFSLVIK